MSESWKAFHIGDLITVTTGVMVSPTGRHGLFDIVDYMTNTQHISRLVTTIDDGFLPDVQACKVRLLELYPWLGEVTVPSSVRDEATNRVFLDMVSDRYGSHHQVPADVPHQVNAGDLS